MDISEKTEAWKFFAEFNEEQNQESDDKASKQLGIRKRALFYCAEFLPGAWRTIGTEEFVLSKISGGFTNMMFLCALADSVKTVESEPRKVLIRIQSQTNTHLLVREAVVFSSLADHGYGPRLLGVFDGGRLEEFIPSRTLVGEELTHPGVILHLSSLLCRIHTLSQPTPFQAYSIKQSYEWIDVYDKQSEGADFELRPGAISGIPEGTYPAKVSPEDLRNELRAMEKRFAESGSPLVFCHKDMIGPNILWKEGFEIANDGTVTKNGMKTDEDPLVLIDFEFGGYDYRGFELGTHVGEYGNDFGTGELGYTMDHTKSTPELRKLFCEGYVKEAYKSGKSASSFGFTGDLNKDVENLYQEMTLFIEGGSLYYGLYNIMWTEDSGLTGMEFLQHARDRLIMYYYNKHIRENGQI